MKIFDRVSFLLGFLTAFLGFSYYVLDVEIIPTAITYAGF